MTTKKKVALSVGLTIGIPVAIFLIVVSSFMLYFAIDSWKLAYKHRGWTAIDYCNERWDVRIPNANIEYTFSSCGGFHGDGDTYTVCQYSSRPDDFLKEFKADPKGKNLDKYNQIKECLKSSGIDTNKLIEPDENYIWLHKVQHSLDDLFLIYNQQTNTLYIVESLI